LLEGAYRFQLLRAKLPSCLGAVNQVEGTWAVTQVQEPQAGLQEHPPPFLWCEEALLLFLSLPYLCHTLTGHPFTLPLSLLCL